MSRSSSFKSFKHRYVDDELFIRFRVFQNLDRLYGESSKFSSRYFLARDFLRTSAIWTLGTIEYEFLRDFRLSTAQCELFSSAWNGIYSWGYVV
ncbi:hypothetical protein R1flu_019183 [Riccia fluitans]|uniref:Uncharacterized protein n=1 Tax=Riccia fluitans TaxID=41844 RepID=A0ABD1ZIA6_9MARC